MSPNCLVLGVVRQFLFHAIYRYKLYELLDIQWVAVEEKANWKVEPTQNQDVEVVTKFNDSSIDRMNELVKQEFINNL